MRMTYVLAALVAAVVEHRVTDALSRLGLFLGDFDTYQHTAIVPTLILAAVIFVVFVVAAYRERKADARAVDWAVDLARKASEIPFRRAFGTILALQMLSLLSMESIEQLTTLGHLEGGTSWLGAPVLIAATIAVATALAITIFMRSFLCALLATARAILAVCLDCAISLRIRARRPLFVRRAPVAIVTSLRILASRSGLRAPPGFG